MSGGAKAAMGRLGPVVLLLVLAAGGGCADLGRYAEDRGKDFVDCFTLQGGFGFPAACEIRATDWLVAGVGMAFSTKWGIEGRETVSGHPALHFGLPVFPLLPWTRALLGDLRKRHWHAVLCTYGSVEDFNLASTGPSRPPRRVAESIVLFDLASIPEFREEERYRRKLIDAFDVHVDATMLLSARAGFSAGQFADFLLGFTTLDIAEDDSQVSEDRAPCSGAKGRQRRRKQRREECQLDHEVRSGPGAGP